MIKYSREEFPLRFKVFEHTCKYCGVTFYSNRSTSSYDTPTCRVYDWQNKKGKLEKGGTISPKPKDNASKVSAIAKKDGYKSKKLVKFLPLDNEKCYGPAEDVFMKYFPEENFDAVWNNELRYGSFGDYQFEVGVPMSGSYLGILGITIYQLQY